MWDKYMMENQTKRKCKEIQRCPACGAIPSQRHTITECQQPGLAAIRIKTVAKVKEERDKLGDSIAGQTVTAILDLLDHPDAHTVWVGMWTPEIRARIAANCPWQMKSREYNKVVKALRWFAQGAAEMYMIGEVRVERRRRNTPQEDTRQTTLAELWQSENEGRREAREDDEREFDDRKYDQ
jgi:hypothetical protein